MSDPEDDMNALSNARLPFAVQCLERYGEFHPFGAVMLPDGEIVSTAADPGPPPDGELVIGRDVIEMLREGHRSRIVNGGLKASVIFYEVHLKAGHPSGFTSAVCAAVDHVDGLSVIATLPYELRDGAPTFANTTFEEGEYLIFPEPTVQ